MLRIFGTIVFALVVVTRVAMPQEATGNIEGRVLTADSGVVAIHVTATGPSLPLPRESATDRRGHFRLVALPVGTYRVRLASVGHRPVALEGVIVRLGRTTAVGEIRLERQAVEVTELVVWADRPLVDVASAATVTNLPAEQFIHLPTQRDFRSIAAIAPQANLSYFPGDEVNIAGATGPENAYFLDGAKHHRPGLRGDQREPPLQFRAGAGGQGERLRSGVWPGDRRDHECDHPLRRG